MLLFIVMCSESINNTFILDSLPFKLSQTARVAELLGRNYYKKYIKDKKSILEIDEFFILSFILKNPYASQSDISKMVYKGKAHIGKILASMEDKGYITRSLNINNNIMIKTPNITDKGMQLYRETDKAFIQLAKDTFSLFTDDEIKTLNKLLDKCKNSMLEKSEILF